jgi:glyoxylase-like metal-dependent hydrolase (beta-lactamase superfamily II)
LTITAVHHLNCATMCPLAGRFVGVPRMVAHCLLLETERDGLILVDTGLGTRDVDGSSQLSKSFRRIAGPVLDATETALARVEALGHSARDVRHVVVTHLDVDHAGGLVDFPHATVHLHAREHAAAMARATSRERERYYPAHWAHGPVWSVYTEDGDTWRGLPAITRLRGVDADIGLVPMHGHSRGHSAVIARHAVRWLVHAGDAYFHHNEVGEGHVPLALRAFEKLVETDKAARRASAAALRQLKLSYPDVALFCAHDPDEYADVSSRPA